MSLPKEQNQAIQKLLIDSYIVDQYLKKLRSPFFLSRIDAAAHLRYLPCKKVVVALIQALEREKHPATILYLSQALASMRAKKAIVPIIRKIAKANYVTARRLHAIMITYKKALLPYLIKIQKTKNPTIRLLITEYAYRCPDEALRTCLKEYAMAKEQRVRTSALSVLLRHYPKELQKEPFISSNKRNTLKMVIKAYSLGNTTIQVHALLGYSSNTALHESIIKALIVMTNRNPVLLKHILQRFLTSTATTEREILATVLHSRISYFLLRLHTDMAPGIKTLIGELIAIGRFNDILFFLNKNKDTAIEKTLIAILKTHIDAHPQFKEELEAYVQKSVLDAMGLVENPKKEIQFETHKERPQRALLLAICLAVLASLPILIFATELVNFVSLSWSDIGRLYVVRFNYLLAFYSVAINSIYLLVLLVSARGARMQKILWESKDYRFLYTPNLLPSVSIIAPAFNEEVNIIESAESLLHQRYPNFELIIVNDGSKDTTLGKLITHFALEKEDEFIKYTIQTRPVRGIYRNKNIPNLIVVDKINGGKADSLNVGLNIAQKEYVCGIDADSLLEPEALLKAISVTIDSPYLSVAVGGNICPVNGCEVDMGSLEKVSLPSSFVAKLQSLEYMRAFMSGRVGWAHMNLLLIISGAFGLFKRRTTIATGGYLSKSGKYQKDTVGEDMELVVRLSRYLREKKQRYRIQYAYNANCWTEVPSSWKILHRQRDRWHRGLIDIMLLHSSMIGNPRYGRLGMVAMLYYFLFELIGPFIEVQGFLLVIVAAIIGSLNLPIALLLFSTTILYGILVSASSLYIGELDHEIYGRKDTARLLILAVIENFGFRQVISFWRVMAFFNAMRKNRGWGTQRRTGFQESKKITKG